MDIEKCLDECMEDNEILSDLEIIGSITAIVHILIENKITTVDEFCDLRNMYSTMHAKQIRDDLLKKLGKESEEE